ncbi:Uma2 family endonuclease [Butyrivibrio sp. JL13D10]|uniref:Uma2 family endonuclease n=1 Tax=Butyrivibrio sp. JL13D10 TaxID=3236815 RepID=UPI0038B57278
MTIDEMNQIKDSRGYSFAQLSEYTGVPVITLQRILSGSTKNPRRATLDAIEKVLKGDETVYSGKAYSYEQNSTSYYGRNSEHPAGLQEDEPTYGKRNKPNPKKNGEYTIEDYYAIPEDQKVELIDGCFYDMTAPTPIHQIISSSIFYSIRSFIMENSGSCIVLYSPIDVQLDCNDKTMVQPDIIIVCDDNKIRDRSIYGAPDFVLEILSPSTRRKDMFIKSEKYCNAGVKEYWMIDPKKKVLIVYNFMEEDFTPAIVPLVGDYPMALYAGRLCISLDEISNAIDRFGK